MNRFLPGLSVLIVASISLFFTPRTAHAQQDDGSIVPPGMEVGRYGAGFAFAWPGYGVSGTWRMSEKLTAEAVVAFYSNVYILTGRGRWYVKPARKYEFYGYGSAGFYRENERFYDDSALILGGGAGIETSLPALFDDDELPPISFSWEIGLNLSIGDEYGGLSGIGFGAAAHYRFGDPVPR